MNKDTNCYRESYNSESTVKKTERRTISWLANLGSWFNISSAELFLIASNKVRITMMNDNLRNGAAPCEEELKLFCMMYANLFQL